MLAAFLADTKSTIKSRMNRDETGATAVEYGIMVALIAIVIIVAVTFLGGGLKQMMGDAGCALKGGGTYVAATPASGSTAAVPEGCTT